MKAQSLWQWRFLILAATLFLLAILFRPSSSTIHSSLQSFRQPSTSQEPTTTPPAGLQTYTENNIELRTYTSPFTCDTPHLPPKVRMTTVTGPNPYIIMAHGFDDVVSNFVWKSEWEPHITRAMENYLQAVMSLDSTRDGYMDLGTNIGAHALHFAADRRYRVHMFEPTFANHLLVRCSLAMMGGGREGVRLNTFGVGAESERVCMGLHDGNMGGTEVDKSVQECGEGQAARIGTLDAYYERFVEGKQKFAVVKMDIQGFEVHALQGATTFFESDAAPVAIFFEYDHSLIKDKGSRPRDLVKFIIDRGYDIYRASGHETLPIPLEQFPEDAYVSGNGTDPDLIAVKTDWRTKLEEAGYAFRGPHITGQRGQKS